MLLCMLAFWALTTWGLFQYSLHTPATLGMGAAYYDRSYGLLRACVLYASLGSVTLLALALSLWDTQTAQMLVAEALAARLHADCLPHQVRRKEERGRAALASLSDCMLIASLIRCNAKRRERAK